MEYFVDNIKYLRKKSGLSQVEFAALFGKEGSTVSNWEIGRRSPITADMIMIAEHFHIKLDDLMFTNLATNPDVLTYADDEKELLQVFKQLKSPARRTVINVATELKNAGI